MGRAQALAESSQVTRKEVGEREKGIREEEREGKLVGITRREDGEKGAGPS